MGKNTQENKGIFYSIWTVFKLWLSSQSHQLELVYMLALVYFLRQLWAQLIRYDERETPVTVHWKRLQRSDSGTELLLELPIQ